MWDLVGNPEDRFSRDKPRRQVFSRHCSLIKEFQLLLIALFCSCAGGELFTECILDEKFNECDVRLLMSQIVEGLVYLHEKCIVHLDLKVSSIITLVKFLGMSEC